MKNQKSLNRKLEDELNYQFPKGNKSRGKALVVFAIAQIELINLEKKRKYWEKKYKKSNEEIQEIK